MSKTRGRERKFSTVSCILKLFSNKKIEIRDSFPLPSTPICRMFALYSLWEFKFELKSNESIPKIVCESMEFIELEKVELTLSYNPFE